MSVCVHRGGGGGGERFVLNRMALFVSHPEGVLVSEAHLSKELPIT